MGEDSIETTVGKLINLLDQLIQEITTVLLSPGGRIVHKLDYLHEELVNISTSRKNTGFCEEGRWNEYGEYIDPLELRDDINPEDYLDRIWDLSASEDDLEE